jgi:hypothetical protein
MMCFWCRERQRNAWGRNETPQIDVSLFIGIVVDLHLGIMCADERQIWMAVKATCLSPQFSRAGSAELSQFAKT